MINAYRTHKSQSDMFEYLEQKAKNFLFHFIVLIIDILYENLLFVVLVHDSTIVDKHHKLHLHLSLEDHLLLFKDKDTISIRLLSITNVFLTDEFHDFVCRNMQPFILLYNLDEDKRKKENMFWHEEENDQYVLERIFSEQIVWLSSLVLVCRAIRQNN